jgi:hypothetical protein
MLRKASAFEVVLVVVTMGAALHGGCARSETEQCADGLRCPVGTSCVPTDTSGWECAAGDCGNQRLESGEICDGEALACLDFGYHLGHALCTANCRSWDLADCRDLAWRDEMQTVSGAFNAIWGATPESILAVGESGALLGYDGKAWRTRAPVSDASLHDVWGFGIDDAIAVGEQSTILRFDGAGWTPMAAPGENIHFEGVWGSAPDDIYAVGHDGVVARYDGQAWNMTELPLTDGLAVWGSGPADVYVVGAIEAPDQTVAAIVHFDGKDWSTAYRAPPEPIPGGAHACTSGILRGIWGSGPDDVTAVGTAFCSDASGNPVKASWIVRGSGMRWTTELVANTEVEQGLDDVWGSSAGDIFAVGSSGQIWHHDGQSWTRMRAGRGASLTGVWGFGTDDVLAIGHDSTLLRFRGFSLEEMSYPDLDIASVWGTSSHELYAAGHTATIEGQTPAVVRYDGEQWSALAMSGEPLSATLHDLWGGLPDGGVVAVGASTDGAGIAVRCSQAACATPDRLPGATALHAVWVADTGEIFAAGAGDSDRGVVAIYRNGTWEAEGYVEVRALRAIWGRSADDVFAVGDDGSVLHHDGSRWQVIGSDLPADRDLRGVWGGDLGVYAVGSGGLIARYRDRTWQRMDVPGLGAGASIVGIAGRAEDDIFAVVENAPHALLHHDGSAWQLVGSPFPGRSYGMIRQLGGRDLALLGNGELHRLRLPPR